MDDRQLPPPLPDDEDPAALEGRIDAYARALTVANFRARFGFDPPEHS
jgi:hypothetical protein